MNNQILQTVWDWLNDKNHELKGIGYEIDGKIVGLAHYRKLLSPLKGKYIGYLDDIFVDPEYRGQKIAKKLLSPLKGKYIGYLDDIFVDPEYRGQKIGKKLLDKIKEISKANGWNLVRWQTDEDNFTAKKLYDKIATKTKKNVYELK